MNAPRKYTSMKPAVPPFWTAVGGLRNFFNDSIYVIANYIMKMGNNSEKYVLLEAKVRVLRCRKKFETDKLLKM